MKSENKKSKDNIVMNEKDLKDMSQSELIRRFGDETKQRDKQEA